MVGCLRKSHLEPTELNINKGEALSLRGEFIFSKPSPKAEVEKVRHPGILDARKFLKNQHLAESF